MSWGKAMITGNSSLAIAYDRLRKLAQASVAVVSGRNRKLAVVSVAVAGE